MFAKSKKIVTPLIALLVACMAVEAAPVVAVPLPQNCFCGGGYLQVAVPNPVYGGYEYVDGHFESTQAVCTKIGQANGAVYNSTSTRCDIGVQSGYDSFQTGCADTFIMDPLGDLHNGVPICSHTFPNVPPPQVCTCSDPSGVNTLAQTTKACTGLITNLGTMVGDKCFLQTQGQYSSFSSLCYRTYPGSAAVCANA